MQLSPSGWASITLPQRLGSIRKVECRQCDRLGRSLAATPLFVLPNLNDFCSLCSERF